MTLQAACYAYMYAMLLQLLWEALGTKGALHIDAHIWEVTIVLPVIYYHDNLS